MAGELEKDELMCWYLYGLKEVKLVPLPGMSIGMDLTLGSAMRAALPRTKFVVFIHPRLPQIGVVAKLLDFTDKTSSVLVNFDLLRRVNIVSVKQGDVGPLVKMRKFKSVLPSDEEFKSLACVKNRMYLANSFVYLAKKLGYENLNVEDITGPGATPKKFEGAVDFIACAIQHEITDSHPLLVDGFVSVLGESNLMLRAERIREMLAWIREKLFYKENFSYDKKIERPAIFFGTDPENPDDDLDAKFPEEVKKVIREESARLKANNCSTDAHVIKRYIDTLMSLPWNISTEEKTDVVEARRVLDEDTFGLTKVKERVLEFLAIRQLNPKAKGGSLCIAGPPGSGKTALAKSVARALGRKMERISLGGLRDAAELKGHPSG